MSGKRYRNLQALKGVGSPSSAASSSACSVPTVPARPRSSSILAGLNRADSSRVSVLGHDVVDDYRMARRVLGVVPQELVFRSVFHGSRDAARPIGLASA